MRISKVGRWLLNKPGTMELAQFSKLLPEVGEHEQWLRELTDAELTAAAAQAADDPAEICACGREAARRGLGERPYDVQVLGTLAMLSGLVAEMATGEGKTLSGALAAAGYALRGLSDTELTEAAGDAVEDAQLCAAGREAARRALGERPFDVQLIGTMAMLSGQVAEMATGEGKTLAGAIAAAGYALSGRSVHVVAVNDYLARRDAEWMRPVYDLMGVTVGWINQSSTPEERRQAYAADVTYAPVSEIGFDVLRDRLALREEDMVTAPPDVALVDEADSVLIDEARVPLVLAGSAEEGNADQAMAEIVRGLDPETDYEIDEDARNVQLTEAGAKAAEKALGDIDLYTEEQLGTLTGSTWRCTPTRCCSAMSTTSSPARRSAWSASRAAGWPGCSGCPTACTPRSRPRRG